MVSSLPTGKKYNGPFLKGSTIKASLSSFTEDCFLISSKDATLVELSCYFISLEVPITTHRELLISTTIVRSVKVRSLIILQTRYKTGRIFIVLYPSWSISLWLHVKDIQSQNQLHLTLVFSNNFQLYWFGSSSCCPWFNLSSLLPPCKNFPQ